MVLKKQTVWLLTMLSLIIVLSVYYITAPGQPNDQFAMLEVDEEEEMNVLEEGFDFTDEEMDAIVNIEEGPEGAESADDSVIQGIADDEVFTSIRLEREESRERLSEEYTNIVASDDVSAELKSEALDKIDSLQVLSQQESMLETLIRSKGYDDVLVITEDEQVKIIVKADELSSEQGNEIMMMAREQLGDKTVAVAHQPAE
ncbi:SpoIIIAH-like family protein [Desertibacillus haloalkaliphilus]|uniref:SpoIIIAH-like family protein n=1 Tax=Desertibacillus haloalkaliphilus TaxID=1328930 RepID=UPI001C27FDF8|nr:SpoIIIAH-like family protein [Desertibacillus haloalkaliphilus]MBU8907728.1 SpoIIIAH-like family protein [Desertibacillus haloalkaliphilus]